MPFAILPRVPPRTGCVTRFGTGGRVDRIVATTPMIASTAMSPTVYSPTTPEGATAHRPVRTVSVRALTPSPRRAARRLGAAKVVMAVLSVLVAAYAVALLVAPSLRPPLMQQRFDRYPVSTGLHLAMGALVIVLAPLQLSTRLRQRFALLHRWGGRTYGLGVLLSGLAGLALATVSQGGLPAHLGFGLLSVAWIVTTAIGVHRIRTGDVAGHRRWMIRSFALTFAAVTLRIYIPLAVVLQLPAELSYQAIAWLCWVPNLVVAEWGMR